MSDILKGLATVVDVASKVVKVAGRKPSDDASKAEKAGWGLDMAGQILKGASDIASVAKADEKPSSKPAALPAKAAPKATAKKGGKGPGKKR